ncbi:hypothetical protein H4W30_007477 [Amycolatopsis roodepoortensis]|uniref:Uncharacterized protein n=1 Tax=Amycolatopsis roodepoortensis TaxID=700274 RepID=A0ABR9LI85_9PSEU|nr:hypothetical protein [Amycolatopsis roodepoortensis]
MSTFFYGLAVVLDVTAEALQRLADHLTDLADQAGGVR